MPPGPSHQGLPCHATWAMPPEAALPPHDREPPKEQSGHRAGMGRATRRQGVLGIRSLRSVRTPACSSPQTPPLLCADGYQRAARLVIQALHVLADVPLSCAEGSVVRDIRTRKGYLAEKRPPMGAQSVPGQAKTRQTGQERLPVRPWAARPPEGRQSVGQQSEANSTKTHPVETPNEAKPLSDMHRSLKRPLETCRRMAAKPTRRQPVGRRRAKPPSGGATAKKGPGDGGSAGAPGGTGGRSWSKPWLSTT